jgi:thioredoxin 1
MAIPTLLFFKDGKPVKRIIGYASEEEIRKFLATLV